MPAPTRIMIDIETLGIPAGSAILEICARTFDAATGILGDPLVIEIDLLSSLAMGFSTDPETAEWHLAKNNASHLRGKTFEAAMRTLQTWFGAQPADHEVWAWGIDFEASHLRAAWPVAGLEGDPWPYYRSRDARTLWHAVFPNEKPTPHQHRAQEDVAIQCRDTIRALIAIQS